MTNADMSAEIFEVAAPERINSPIWLAYLGGVNVVKWGLKVVKRGVPVLIPFLNLRRPFDNVQTRRTSYTWFVSFLISSLFVRPLLTLLTISSVAKISI